MKFENIEDAVAALNDEKKAHDETKRLLEKEKKRADDAEKVATEAVEDANKVLATGKPSKPTVTVKGKKYEVKFGVDGLTKEELAQDTKKLEKLVSIGSGALKLVK